MKTVFKALAKRITVITVVLAVVLCSVPVLYMVGASSDAGTALIENGNFENGTAGFTNKSAATYEVIAEPGNEANHVLHVGGGGQYYQTVTVKKNTDYIWTFRLMKLDDQISVYADVYSEDFTSNLVLAVAHSGNTGYSSMYNGRAAIDCNNGVWCTFMITFNSGDNTKVHLQGDTWTANRDMYTDDWVLEEVPESGELTNGDFEDGTNGFINSNAATFEVIEDPDDSANHVLHLIGGNSEGDVGTGQYHQSVSVDKNTDYVWTFRMKDLGNTGTTRITVHPESTWDNLIKSISHVGNGYSSMNDGTYASVATYNKEWVTFTVAFNSGSNTTVRLWHNVWASSREIYMDDWKLEEVVIAEESMLVNGDFEDGTNGYTNSNTATFEVITDPDDAQNHVLHLIGGGNYHQQVSVEKNTDYVWTFRMKDLGNTGTTRITVHPESGWDNLITSISHTGNGYSSMNDGTYASAATYGKSWVTFTVTFNSGENTFIKLWHNTWTTNREIHMDDWTLNKAAVPGELVNPDFEDGSNGYVNESCATFEVIEDPADASNHVMHAGGGGKFHQAVAVEKNTDYLWVFSLKKLDDQGSIYADVIPTTSAQSLVTTVSHSGAGAYSSIYNERAAIDVDNNGSWALFMVRFNSGENTAVKLQFDTWTTNRDMYIDNWELGIAPAIGDLSNGDFENGNTDSFRWDSYVTADVTTEDVHSGEYAAMLTKNSQVGSGEFFQSVQVEKNSDYIWTFWAKFVNPDTPVGAYVKGISGVSRINGDCDTVLEPSVGWHRIRYADNEWHEYRIMFSSGDKTTVDLTFMAYASNALILTDDWTLDKVGDTPAATDTVFEVGFEHENMGCHEISKPCWTRTDERAHSGEYSIKFDGSASSGPLDLLYLDEYGIIRDVAALEPNSTYRVSFWYKGEGQRLDMANVSLKIYHSGTEFEFTGIYQCADEEWNYAEVIYDSNTYTSSRFMLSGMILGSRKFTMYIDDIKVEKVTSGVTDANLNPDEVVCEDSDNLAPDSTVGTVSAGENKVQKLELKPYGIYNFAVSYNAIGAWGKVGLALDEQGTSLEGAETMFTAVDSMGVTEKQAFTFVAPADGIVYFIAQTESGTIDITDMTLYSVLPDSAVPVDKVELKNPTSQDKGSIWDQEFEFDFDWNTEFGEMDDSYYDTDIGTDTDNSMQITDPEENEETKTASGKKYLQVKKRKLIKKGEPGISVAVIAAIIAAAVAVAAGITLFIILIAKKKKKNAANKA